jgi:CheY-like chemotaxis protein
MARIIAVLKRVRRNGDDILYAKFVADQMAQNPLFGSPPIPFAKIESDIEALQAAEAHTLTRSAEAVSARNACFALVWCELQRLRSYVQMVADASPGSAAAIVESAGMCVKKSSGHGRAAFKAAKGPRGGSVSLFGQREKTRASYEWQFSLDGTTWQTGAWTVKASAVIDGLESGKRYFFRFRSVTKAGMGDFGQVITFVVPWRGKKGERRGELGERLFEWGERLFEWGETLCERYFVKSPFASTRCNRYFVKPPFAETRCKRYLDNSPLAETRCKRYLDKSPLVETRCTRYLDKSRLAAVVSLRGAVLSPFVAVVSSLRAVISLPWRVVCSHREDLSSRRRTLREHREILSAHREALSPHPEGLCSHREALPWDVEDPADGGASKLNFPRSTGDMLKPRMATDVGLISNDLASFYDFAGTTCLFVGAGSRIALAPAHAAGAILVVDRDPAAIARLREDLSELGMRERVELRTARFEDALGDFDVVYFEFCLHEMNDPAAALRKAKSMAPDVIVLDHAVGSEWMHCAALDEDVRRAGQAIEGFRARRRERRDGVQSFASGDELAVRLSRSGAVALSRARCFAGRSNVSLAMPYELVLL